MTAAAAVVAAAAAALAVAALVVAAYRLGRRYVHAECVQLRITVADLIKRMDSDRRQVAAARDYIAKLNRNGGAVTTIEIDAVLERLTEREISAFTDEERRLTEKFKQLSKDG